MIEGVLRLADRSIESIMVPRVDIIWLDSNATLEDLWSEARASGHSRFLVCDGELSKLLGVITPADLGEALRLGDRDLGRQLRPPLRALGTLSVLKLVELFREANVHLAIVAGEFDDIDGLVTPADILKAIAGDLPEWGEHARAEAIQREDGIRIVAPRSATRHRGDAHLARPEIRSSRYGRAENRQGADLTPTT